MLCPDLRGLGWSGQPVDGDERKQRMADDAIALLDALGLDRVRLVGHDWGAWAAILAALTAPERVSSLLAISIGHPWTPIPVAARHAWLLAYQLPLALPLAGERLVREGRYAEWMLTNGRRDAAGWGRGEVDAYLAVLRDPSVARASSRMYRDFLVRELPAAARGAFHDRRPAMPSRLLLGSREPFRPFAPGFPGETEFVEGAGHFLPEEAPEAVAERIRAM
jgi:pimeloyl-ACP methyl ester carboxylesterase